MSKSDKDSDSKPHSDDSGRASPTTFRERIRIREERDKAWLARLNLKVLNRSIASLLAIFVFLSALDVFTTRTAMNVLPSFHEFNVLAASLFHNQVEGLLVAVVLLKAVPVVVILYALFLKEKNHHSHQVRAVKLGVSIALILFNIFYGYVVLFNNLVLLMQYA